MKQVDDYVSALQKIKERSLENPTDLEMPKDELINLLPRIYGSDSQQKEQVVNIRHHQSIGSGSINNLTGETSGFAVNDNFASCKRRFHGLIESFIDELEDFGLPSNTVPNSENAGVKITVNQNQTVHVNTVLEVLQRELTETQISDLKAILSSSEPPNQKQKRVAEKIQSFGGSIAARIIGSILTNPQIIGLFK